MFPGHTLVPAIHVFSCGASVKSWMPGTSPGMTNTEGAIAYTASANPGTHANAPEISAPTSARKHPPAAILGLGRRRGRRTEQALEERRAAAAAAKAVVEGDALRDVALRPGIVRLRMGDDVFEVAALHVAQDVDHGGVAAVEVLADLQLAGVIDEGGLVGDVDRDRGREFEVDFAVAIHAADLLRRVVLV